MRRSRRKGRAGRRLPELVVRGRQGAFRVAGALAVCCAVGLASGASAQAGSCGGLFQPRCSSTTSPSCGGLLQPACPTKTTTTTRAACGGLLQPRCPTASPGTGTGTGGTTTTTRACGGLLQPRCPPAPSQCSDGSDNDKDGQRDLLDAGCADASDRSEYDDVAPDANGLPRGGDVDPRTSGRHFGFNTFLGSWNSGILPEQEIDLIQAAGGNMQRFTISWAIAQPSAGYYRTDRLAPKDKMYNAAVARGVVPIITLGDAPVWASDLRSCGLLDWKCRELRRNPPDHLPPADIEAYGRFAAWVAARYPAAVIESWNEPNIRYFWAYSRFPDTARAAEMQCAAYDYVKELDPSRTVLSPGFAMIRSQPASGQIPYVDFVDPMHSWMGAGRRCWDALSVHIYPSSKVDGDGSSTAMAMKAIRAVRTRHGDTTPIWVTETGASTSGGEGGDHGHTQRTDSQQAEMMRLTINELLTTPDIGAVVMHTLRDRMSPLSMQSTPASTQYGFGALAEGPGPTPAPKPLWCHLVGVTQVAYPGCTSAGTMTARSRTLRARQLQNQRTARQMTAVMQRRG